ncbi:MAG: hypothetical protein SFY68_02180 [Candidatus Sumerlaeia bacterium]|nr:hypothetical protein [Candidatus Sumerlaeia bacterium]
MAISDILTFHYQNKLQKKYWPLLILREFGEFYLVASVVLLLFLGLNISAIVVMYGILGLLILPHFFVRLREMKQNYPDHIQNNMWKTRDMLIQQLLGNKRYDNPVYSVRSSLIAFVGRCIYIFLYYTARIILFICFCMLSGCIFGLLFSILGLSIAPTHAPIVSYIFYSFLYYYWQTHYILELSSMHSSVQPNGESLSLHLEIEELTLLIDALISKNIQQDPDWFVGQKWELESFLLYHNVPFEQINSLLKNPYTVSLPPSSQKALAPHVCG